MHRIALAVSIFFAASIAHALESRSDEALLRTMVIEPPSTESKCIGDPITPLCAVETFVACYFWNDMRLCRAVGFVPNFPIGVDEYFALKTLHYRLIGEALLKDEDIPDWARQSDVKPSPWKAGDLALDVFWDTCRPEDQCVTATRDSGRKLGEGCPMTWCHSDVETYILRKVRGRWHFISFWSPGRVQGKESWPNKPAAVPILDSPSR